MNYTEECRWMGYILRKAGKGEIYKILCVENLKKRIYMNF
jgi:hypothetical protein